MQAIDTNDEAGLLEIIESELNKGAEKARTIAREVLQRVRQNIGYFNG